MGLNNRMEPVTPDSKRYKKRFGMGSVNCGFGN